MQVNPNAEQSSGYFVNCGRSAYALIVDDVLRGVLYWTEQLAEDGEESGTDYDWCWMDRESPQSHVNLAAPPLLGGMTQEQVEANTNLAMETLEHLLGY